MIIEFAFVFFLGVVTGMKIRDFLNTLVVHKAQEIAQGLNKRAEEELKKKGKSG